MTVKCSNDIKAENKSLHEVAAKRASTYLAGTKKKKKNTVDVCVASRPFFFFLANHYTVPTQDYTHRQTRRKRRYRG